MESLVLAAVLGSALVVGAGAAATPGTGAGQPVLPAAAAARQVVGAGLAVSSAVGRPAPVSPGEPSGCDGVVVAVDGGVLDSDARGSVSTLGCAAVGGPLSAHDAVIAAGVELQGTGQWGEAFVCRVAGRPALDEEVRRADGSVGSESCLRTPSQGASWALWTSTDASTWTYATRGVTSLEVAPGDVVGLVFVTSESPEPPRVSPGDARAGIAPDGWSTVVGTGSAPAGPEAGGETADGLPSVGGPGPATSSPSVDGSGGVVALVGLGLAGGLLGLAVLRARARRP